MALWYDFHLFVWLELNYAIIVWYSYNCMAEDNLASAFQKCYIFNFDQVIPLSIAFTASLKDFPFSEVAGNCRTFPR